MTRRMSAFIALAAAGAIFAAGCGSSSSSSSTTALTKDEFISQADAICKQGNQTINAAAKKVFTQGQQPSQQEVTQFVDDTVIPSIQGQVDDIKALTPPSGDEDTINTMLADVQSAIDQAKQDPSVVTQSNGSGPFAKANQEAQAYGLKECGKG